MEDHYTLQYTAVIEFGAQSLGRQTNWATDVLATNHLGNGRVGNTLGRLCNHRFDEWATD